MNIKATLWQLLDTWTTCDVTLWDLYDAMHSLTGACTMPHTLRRYVKEYAAMSGGSFACVDGRTSMYRYIPGAKLSGAIID